MSDDEKPFYANFMLGAYSTSGQLCLGTSKGALLKYDVNAQVKIWEEDKAHEHEISAIEFVDSYKAMISADVTGAIILWDIGTDTILQKCNFGEPLNVIRVYGDTVYLAGRHVKIWQFECIGGHDGVEDLTDKQYLLQKLSDESEK